MYLDSAVQSSRNKVLFSFNIILGMLLFWGFIVFTIENAMHYMGLILKYSSNNPSLDHPFYLLCYFLTVEHLCYLFWRTRCSLFYGTRILTLIQAVYLVYCSCSMLPFYDEAFLCLLVLSYGIIFFCFTRFEKPASEKRDNDIRKPVPGRFRTVYQPFFSLT